MKNLTEGPVKEIFKKMFSIANLDFNTVDQTTNWYDDYTWTTQQQDEFKVWFLDILYKNKKYRECFNKTLMKNKSRILTQWQWFNLEYGFRIKEIINNE